MPLYDFECQECHARFELEHPRGVEPPLCITCGGTQTEKLLSPPPVIFKGGGFYKTDSGRSTKKSPSEELKRESQEGAKNTEGKVDFKPKSTDSTPERKE